MTNLNSQIKTLLSDESFQRWLDGRASEEEERKWSEWLRTDRLNRIIYNNAVFIWRAIQFRSSSLPAIKNEWNKFKHRFKLNANSISSDPIKDEASGSTSSAINFRSLSKIGRRSFAVAASLLLIFAIGHFGIRPIAKHSHSHWKLITTDYGQRKYINPSRDIKIILNANSTLKYTTAKKSEFRQFQLHGEAYFNVSHHPGKSETRLCVQTCDGLIEVVGTRFVVYERNEGTKVAVEQGRLKIFVASKPENSNSAKSTAITLDTGNLLCFCEGDESPEQHPVNIDVYTSWRSDELIFDNTTFREIIQRLTETYNVQFDVEQKLLDQTISGSIENSNLDVIIDALAKALQANVKINGDKVIIKST
ncbi:DUF4974 domain-containing protein [candidate division KSB1 bacterium]|nr:DUF4974 domain-containing protein [candidate division KSB1 bacterium]